MAQRLAIGVDVGGTKLAFVLINEQGETLATHQLPTNPDQGTAAILDHIAQGIRVMLESVEGVIAGIGIGIPGHVNPLTGVVRSVVNLGWTEVPLRIEVAHRLPIDAPIHIQKDTNAAAVGEMLFGAARGVQDFVYIAVGTGLGAGAVVGGRLIEGANFFPTEVGHLSLDPYGRQCTCGLRGCPEMYISGKGLMAGLEAHRAMYPESDLAKLKSPSTEHILQAARAGDPLGLLIIEEGATWFGAILAACTGILNPDLVVVGGGLGHAAADLLLTRTEQEIRKRVLPATYEKLQIVKSEIGNSAIGAACLALIEPTG